MAGGRRANRASKAVKTAELAVDIKAEPETVDLDGTHATNGFAMKEESLAAAVNGVEQAKPRKSRATAKNGSVKAPVDPAIKMEPAESMAADLAASIQ